MTRSKVYIDRIIEEATYLWIHVESWSSSASTTIGITRQHQGIAYLILWFDDSNAGHVSPNSKVRRRSGSKTLLDQVLKRVIISPTPLGPEQLVPRLLAEPDTAEGLPSEYLVELVARFSDDGLDQVIMAKRWTWSCAHFIKPSSTRSLAPHWWSSQAAYKIWISWMIISQAYGYVEWVTSVIWKATYNGYIGIDQLVWEQDDCWNGKTKEEGFGDSVNWQQIMYRSPPFLNSIRAMLQHITLRISHSSVLFLVSLHTQIVR